MQIIGVMGRKQHGKDTVAKFLIEEHGFVMYDDFSTSIRKALCEIFGWDMSVFDTEESKETIDEFYGITPRQGMQSLGDDYGKKLLCSLYPQFKETTGDLLWVKRWVQKLDKIYQQMKVDCVEPKIIIPGVRFPGEVELIHRLNGEVWKVVNPRKELTDTHSSEMHVDTLPYDEYISNGHTLEILRMTTLASYDNLIRRSQSGKPLYNIPEYLIELVS